MFTKLFRTIVIICLIVLGIAFVSGFSVSQIKEVFSSKFFSALDNIDKKISSLKEEKQSEIGVGSEVEDDSAKETPSVLDSYKVFEITNIQRKNNSLSVLTWNNLLSKAATQKAKDMFAKQYFAHNTPDGKTPSDFVLSAGYSFITTGENLALGVFKTEEALVKAWMDSPGHRENILNGKFRELGVSVVKGTYEGDEVIIAVQEFGTSDSLCHKPDETEKTALSNAFRDIEVLGEQINLIKQRIENMEKNDRDYKAVIESYNVLVQNYNIKIETLKTRTNNFNTIVSAYNKCLDSI